MEKAPNFLVIFTDQQRRDTIHSLGNSRICTPALDSLADSSIIFDNCITPAPVCVPARYSMFSGLYPGHAGCCNNNATTAYKGAGYYSHFTEQGYHTFSIGKMHHPTGLYDSMGFESRLVQEEMADLRDDYTKFLLASPYRNVFDYNGMRSEMYYVPQISQLPMEYHPTQWVGDNGVRFLNEEKMDRPFFLMVSFIHPHPPFAPPSPWNKIYRTVSEDPYIPDHPEAFEDFLSDRFACEKIGISRQDLTLLKNYYYSCITFVDYQIGRMLNVLKERELYDNTVILFSSDHGEMLGDFNTMGKRSMLDGAVRIPFLLHIPNHGMEHRYDVCSLVDVAPTLLSLAGIEYKRSEFDGINLLGTERHSEVYSQYSTGITGTYMVASEYDKLIYSGIKDKYYYFNTSPERHNDYDVRNERFRYLKTLLDKYQSEDKCKDGSGATDAFSGQSKFPYGPKRADHSMRHDEELARMPDGYTIDL